MLVSKVQSACPYLAYQATPSGQMAAMGICSPYEDATLLRLNRFTRELEIGVLEIFPKKSRLTVTLIYGTNSCLLAYPTRSMAAAFYTQIAQFPADGWAMAKPDQLSAKRAVAVSMGNPS